MRERMGWDGEGGGGGGTIPGAARRKRNNPEVVLALAALLCCSCSSGKGSSQSPCKPNPGAVTPASCSASLVKGAWRAGKCQQPTLLQ